MENPREEIIQKLEKLGYLTSGNYIYQKNGANHTVGQLKKKGIVEINYPSKIINISEVQEILDFREQLKKIGIKYFKDVSKTVSGLSKSIQERKNLRIKLIKNN